MSLATGRTNRRRRMLQDGRLAADADTTTTTDAAGGAPRYAADETSVSLGLAGRVLPTGPWSLPGTLLGLLSVVALLVVGDVYRDAVAATAGADARSAVDMAAPGSLAGWFNTALSLSIAAMCGVVYGLRRRRSDDLRGLYRWWLSAAVAMAAVSVCLATGVHHLLAAAIAAQVGWSPLPNNALWWLVPAAPLGLIALKAVLDLKESRLAAVAAAVAVLAGGVSLSAACGWAPASVEPHVGLVGAAAIPVGLSAGLFSLLAYARRIVLEANGRVAAPAKPAKKDSPLDPVSDAAKTAATKAAPAKPKLAAATKPAARKTTRDEPPAAEPSPRRQPAARKPAADTATQWVDGSQGAEDDDYGDGPSRRKLSKAERKRLRRQKARENRAA